MARFARCSHSLIFLVAASALACEDERPASHALEAAAAEVFLKVEEAGAGIDLYFSTPAHLTALGVCALSDAVAACDASADAYKAATSLGKGRERQFFRVTLGTVAPGSVLHVVDVGVAGVFTRLARFQLVDQQADPIDAGLALLGEATLRQELTDLASDDFNGRLAGTPESERAAARIADTLKALGIEPARPGTYLQEFTLANGPMTGKKTANVAGLIPGSDPALKDEYVVIGAHLDHAGTLQRGYTCSAGGGGDNICNGADDNGSGTVAVLNVAKALAATRATLKRSVVVMWFSGEEEGLLGSRHYVEREPLVPIEKTVYMINLDMVGYMSSNGNQLAALGAGTSDAGARILDEIGGKYPGRGIRPTDRAGGGSDHVPFMARGVPGVFFHTGVSNNRNYHRTSDSPDKIDYPGMLVATKIAFETAFRVATAADLTVRAAADRVPLVTEDEQRQTCHHLMQNPFAREALPDFTNGNDGGAGP